MTLLSGDQLNPNRFFRAGSPLAQASSFDLTIGRIFDHDGKEVDGPYTLKPGAMVQVVSAEVFNLDADITGHVTYKTSLTRIGIWALTVGIVDPGWDGPIATTLLNFGRGDYAVDTGDPFLRVSFFQHNAVPSRCRQAPPLKDYLKGVAKLAASTFPATFLDSDKIAETAGRSVLERIRKEALVWVAGIAIIFTVLQLVVSRQSPTASISISELTSRVEQLRTELDTLKTTLKSR